MSVSLGTARCLLLLALPVLVVQCTSLQSVPTTPSHLQSVQAIYSYPTYSDVVNRLHTLANTYPGLVDVWDAQTKYGVASPSFPCTGSTGQEPCRHWFVTVTNKTAPVNPLEGIQFRPQVFFSGNLHGDEWVGPVTVLNFVETLVAAAMPGSATYNSFFNRLVNSRTLIAIPVTNPAGYDAKVRAENSVDPNRDFPMFRSPSACMVTTVARAVNEVWRDNLIQAAITFHGGMQAIGYEWGVEEHKGPSESSESPDDAAQADLGGTMRAAAGSFVEGYFPTGPTNKVVYWVDGGMEDWAYASSWDTTPGASQPCSPTSYGGYPTEKTTYNSAVLRAFNVLVETANDKIPAESKLGSNTGLDAVFTVEGKGDGHVPRNMRLSLAVLDLVEPYVHATASRLTGHGTAERRMLRNEKAAPRLQRGLQPVPLTFTGPGACTFVGSDAGAGHCVLFKDQYTSWSSFPATASNQHEGELRVAAWAGWDVGGAMHVDSTAALIGTWDARLPPSLFHTAVPVDPSSPTMPSSAFVLLLMNTYGFNDKEAASFAWYLHAWQEVSSGKANADSLQSSYVLDKSASAMGATRWAFDAGAGGTATYTAGRQLATPAFTTRFSACVRIYAGAPSEDGAIALAPEPCDESDVPATSSGSRLLSGKGEAHIGDRNRSAQAGSTPSPSSNSPFAGSVVRALLVLPYARVDSHWTGQKRPEPNVLRQSHMANVRTTPEWLQQNAGYTARGRYQFSSPVFLGVETRVGIPPGPTPTSTPSASSSPTNGGGAAAASAGPSTGGSARKEIMPASIWEVVGLVLGVPALLACCVVVYMKFMRRNKFAGAVRLGVDSDNPEGGYADDDEDEEGEGADVTRPKRGRDRPHAAYTDAVGGEVHAPTAAEEGGLELASLPARATASKGAGGGTSSRPGKASDGDKDSIDLELDIDEEKLPKFRRPGAGAENIVAAAASAGSGGWNDEWDDSESEPDVDIGVTSAHVTLPGARAARALEAEAERQADTEAQR